MLEKAHVHFSINKSVVMCRWRCMYISPTTYVTSFPWRRLQKDFSNLVAIHRVLLYMGNGAFPYPEPVYTGWSSVHWDATGMPLVYPVYTGIPLGDPENTWLADASTQWCPSGEPVLICIIGTHWKTTGKPLEDHLKHTGNTLATNNSFSNGIPVYTAV